MQTPRSIAIREPRRGGDFSQELAEKGWYHSFDWPTGLASKATVSRITTPFGRGSASRLVPMEEAVGKLQHR